MTNRWAALWVAVLVAGDAVTKAFIHSTMHEGGSVVVIPGFLSLTYVRNPGGAFGMLAGLADPWRQAFFVVIACATVGFLLWLWGKVPAVQRFQRLAIVLVIAGAVGNLIDRFAYGEVVDFLDFYLGSAHWPAFNIADTCISVGAAGLVLASFVHSPDHQRSSASPH